MAPSRQSDGGGGPDEGWKRTIGPHPGGNVFLRKLEQAEYVFRILFSDYRFFRPRTILAGLLSDDAILRRRRMLWSRFLLGNPFFADFDDHGTCCRGESGHANECGQQNPKDRWGNTTHASTVNRTAQLSRESAWFFSASAPGLKS